MRAEPHILIVEDEAPKSKHIEDLVMSLAPTARLSTARSVNSALDCLADEQVDLLLLDMSLPTFDVGERESGGRPQAFGGTEVLRHMTMAEIACPTVVITGYEGFTGMEERWWTSQSCVKNCQKNFRRFYAQFFIITQHWMSGGPY